MIIKTTIIIPNTPAVKVLFKLDAPNSASTVLDDISSNFVGNAPELINSTKFLASSSVKFPLMITSLENPCDTVAALDSENLINYHIFLFH